MLPFICFGQDKTVQNDTSYLCEEIFDIVEVMPQYPGGINEMMSFLRQTTIEDSCQFHNCKLISFIIDTNGKVNSPQVIGIDEDCAKNIKEKILEMPEWTPGYQRGKPVCVKFKLAIKDPKKIQN